MLRGGGVGAGSGGVEVGVSEEDVNVAARRRPAPVGAADGGHVGGIDAGDDSFKTIFEDRHFGARNPLLKVFEVLETLKGESGRRRWEKGFEGEAGIEKET